MREVLLYLAPILLMFSFILGYFAVKNKWKIIEWF